MSGPFYWCVTHRRVEPRKGCAMKERLGPYDTREEAEAALDQIKSRNARWDAEDQNWEEG